MLRIKDTPLTSVDLSKWTVHPKVKMEVRYRDTGRLTCFILTQGEVLILSFQYAQLLQNKKIPFDYLGIGPESIVKDMVLRDDVLDDSSGLLVLVFRENEGFQNACEIVLEYSLDSNSVTLNRRSPEITNKVIPLSRTPKQLAPVVPVDPPVDPPDDPPIENVSIVISPTAVTLSTDPPENVTVSVSPLTVTLVT